MKYTPDEQDQLAEFFASLIGTVLIAEDEKVAAPLALMAYADKYYSLDPQIVAAYVEQQLMEVGYLTDKDVAELKEIRMPKGSIQ